MEKKKPTAYEGALKPDLMITKEEYEKLMREKKERDRENRELREVFKGK